MQASKLKSDYLSLIIMIIVAISLFVIISYIKLTVTPEEKNITVGTMWLVFAAIQLFFWLRTFNSGFLFFMIFCLLVSFSYCTDYEGIYFIIPAIILLIIYISNIFRRKFNWRKRDILELAAKPVTGVQDGFTNRPFPAGTVSSSKKRVSKSKGLYKKSGLMPNSEIKSL